MLVLRLLMLILWLLRLLMLMLMLRLLMLRLLMLTLLILMLMLILLMLILMKSCLPRDYAAALMDRHSQEVQTPFKFHWFDGKRYLSSSQSKIWSSSSNHQWLQEPRRVRATEEVMLIIFIPIVIAINITIIPINIAINITIIPIIITLIMMTIINNPPIVPRGQDELGSSMEHDEGLAQ